MAKKIRGRNEGSLYQRSDGKWRAQISVNGKRPSKTFPTKKEAQAWLRAIQADTQHGYDINSQGLKLGLYLQQWLEHDSQGFHAICFCSVFPNKGSDCQRLRCFRR